jgi:FkbM family methyltransferase
MVFAGLRKSARFKEFVRRGTRRFGIDLVQYNPLKRRMTLEEAFQQLHRLGMRPVTVIDVGVAEGTPELYAAFPDAGYLLVDPLEAWAPVGRALADSLGGVYEQVGAAASAGTRRIRVPETGSHATFYEKDNSANNRDWVEQEITTARLDDLVQKHSLEGPYLLKVDVEGAELEVLRGADEVVGNALAITVEVTLFDVFAGGASFAEVIAFMAERGFVLYDVVGGFCRASDRALYQLDVVFLPEPSPFR